MRKPILIIFILLSLIMIISLSSCTLLIDEYNRLVGYNSICWEDNDHILVYAKIAAYDNYATVGGDMKNAIWAGGEIWRINANTGEKELLMRETGPKYTASSVGGVHTDNCIDYVYINLDYTIYKINKENYSDWQLMVDSMAFPHISPDGKTMVGTHDNGDVVTYDLESGTMETLFSEEEGNKISDYDFDRNLLLLNNIRLINLNTGLDSVLIKDRDTIDGYLFSHPESYAKYGRIIDDSIQFDINDNKVYVSIDSLNNRNVYHGLKGIPNSDKTLYASGEDNGVEIRNTIGNIITKVVFDSSGL